MPARILCCLLGLFLYRESTYRKTPARVTLRKLDPSVVLTACVALVLSGAEATNAELSKVSAYGP
jgi:hypothetical protein